MSGLSVQLTFGKLGETLMLGNSPTQFRWIFCGKNACLTLVLSGAFPCHMQAFEVETRNRKLANIRPSLRILHIWLSASLAIALGQVQETREFDLLRREFQAEVQTLSNRPVAGGPPKPNGCRQKRWGVVCSCCVCPGPAIVHPIPKHRGCEEMPSALLHQKPWLSIGSVPVGYHTVVFSL